MSSQSNGNELSGGVVIGCAAAFIGLVALFLLSIIGFFFFTGAREMHRQVRLMDDAVAVEATIVSAEIVRSMHTTSTGTGATRSSSTREVVTPKIVFSFEHDGRPVRGERIYPTLGGGDEIWASRMVTRYPAGRTVQAWMDPDHPEDAFLEKQWVFGPYGLFMAASVGLGFLMSMAAAVTFFWPAVSRGAAGVGVAAWVLGPLYAGVHYVMHPFADMGEPAGSGLPGVGVLVLVFGAILVFSPLPLLAWRQGRRWRRRLVEDGEAEAEPFVGEVAEPE